MERCRIIPLTLLLLLGVLACVVQAKPASELLQEGLYAEETQGDLDAAMGIYEQVISDSSAQRPYVAEATYRLGMCYLKKQNDARAKALFEKIAAQYQDQQQVVEKVQPLLDEMTMLDPATLMPANTKIYMEVGAPGRQVETLLKMLQGTPLANPLAAIGGGGGGRQNGQKTPGDIIAALLNPSMMAEFKKIKGFAVGVTEFQQNNPPVIAVLCPGESDALRAIILAGLGMAGQPGEPIEDMQTVTIQNMVAAAYDNSIVIVTQPPSLLEPTIKRYRGLDTAASLAGGSTKFAKLPRAMRQRNAFTLWVDGAGTYKALAEQLGPQIPQLALVNKIADFDSIEDIVTYAVLEEGGITSETIVNFRQGQQSLAYGLTRTPPLQRAGFAAVPADAVAVASIALGESNGRQVQTAQDTIKQITGLDLGREIFANIEQINLFAVPPRSKAGGEYGIADALRCFGVSITSKDPAQTRRLLQQALGVADMVVRLSADKEIPGQPGSQQDRFLLGILEDSEVYCHIGQTANTTVLALDPSVVAASIGSVKEERSALTEGSLRDSLNTIPPGTNKLVLVNAGGAIRIADEFIKAVHNNPANPGHKIMAQLAEACGKTNIHAFTVETDTSFRSHSSLNGIPPLDGLFPLLMQLGQYDLTAQVKATRPNPPNGATLRVDAEVKLGWTKGAAAVSHKVYFGTDAGLLPLLAEVSNPDEVQLPALKEDVTYYWRVDEVMQDGTVTEGDLWSFALTGKLVGWWKLSENEGQTAKDSSGHGHDGVLGSAAGADEHDPQWVVDSQRGRCLYFDGDDYVNCGGGASESWAQFDGSSFTAAAWVNQSDTIWWSCFVCKGESAWKLQMIMDFDEVHFATHTQGRFFEGNKLTNGRWYHVVGVWDEGQKRAKIYIDGKMVGSQRFGNDYVANNSNVLIGAKDDEVADHEVTTFFKGYLKDIRLYNYALTDEEIREIYEVMATQPQPADGGITGAASGLKPTWKPVSEAVSHKVYFGTDEGNLTLLAEVSSPGQAEFGRLKPDTTYYWRVDEVFDGGTVIAGDVWRFTTSGKLVGWWKLDETEGRDVADSSGNNNIGKILDGTPKWQPNGGKVGGALLLDGQLDFVHIANEQSFDFTDEMTVAAWVKVNSVDKWWQAIVTKGDSAWRFHHYEQSGRVAFHATGLSTPNMRQHGGPAGDADVADGQWHHVAAVYGGGKSCIYIDGRPDNEIDMSGSIATNNEPVCIGENSQARGRAFNGMIDDVRIFDYALSPAEISMLCRGE